MKAARLTSEHLAHYVDQRQAEGAANVTIPVMMPNVASTTDSEEAVAAVQGEIERDKAERPDYLTGKTAAAKTATLWPASWSSASVNAMNGAAKTSSYVRSWSDTAKERSHTSHRLGRRTRGDRRTFHSRSRQRHSSAAAAITTATANRGNDSF